MHSALLFSWQTEKPLKLKKVGEKQTTTLGPSNPTPACDAVIDLVRECLSLLAYVASRITDTALVSLCVILKLRNRKCSPPKGKVEGLKGWMTRGRGESC